MSKLYDQLKKAARARAEGSKSGDVQPSSLLAQALQRAHAERGNRDDPAEQLPVEGPGDESLAREALERRQADRAAQATAEQRLLAEQHAQSSARLRADAEREAAAAAKARAAAEEAAAAEKARADAEERLAAHARAQAEEQARKMQAEQARLEAAERALRAAEERARAREEQRASQAATDRARAGIVDARIATAKLRGPRMGFAAGATLIAMLGVAALVIVQQLGPKETPPQRDWAPVYTGATTLKLDRTLDLTRTGGAARSSPPGPAPSR